MHFSLTCCQKCERQCSKTDLLPGIIRYSLDKRKYGIHYLTGQNRGLSGLKILAGHYDRRPAVRYFQPWRGRKNRSVIVKSGVYLMEKKLNGMK